MGTYTEIKGDLIELAKEGKFDVISHGANCFCMMGAGIAVAMKNSFSADKFELEAKRYRGDYNKLGQIDYEPVNRKTGKVINTLEDLFTADIDSDLLTDNRIEHSVIVVNSYTQFDGGSNLDYTALRMCLKKINFMFKGRSIGLPLIGCGIAGGDWNIVKQLIKAYLKDMDVTIVRYEK